MELENKDVKDLFKSLGSIETGISDLKERVDKLPCQRHTDEIAKRMTWKQVWAIVVTSLAIIFGAMGIHYDITNTIKNRLAIMEQRQDAMDKDYLRAGER